MYIGERDKLFRPFNIIKGVRFIKHFLAFPCLDPHEIKGTFLGSGAGSKLSTSVPVAMAKSLQLLPLTLQLMLVTYQLQSLVDRFHIGKYLRAQRLIFCKCILSHFLSLSLTHCLPDFSFHVYPIGLKVGYLYPILMIITLNVMK